MSIKRTKQRSSGSSRNTDDLPFYAKPAPPEPDKTWDEWVGGQPEAAFTPYSLKTRFERGALMNHPKFGKGAVLAHEGSIIVVLFADGRKKLGHAPS